MHTKSKPTQWYQLTAVIQTAIQLRANIERVVVRNANRKWKNQFEKSIDDYRNNKSYEIGIDSK